MAEPGYAYEVQFKETLDAQDWHTLTNDVTAQETTTTQTATDSTTNARNTSTGGAINWDRLRPHRRQRKKGNLLY